jgi:succinate dehydrogenase / fumarate reductase cytochrome b subunit
MASIGTAAWSSVGKKVINGLTGMLLMGFIVVHLIGNLTLLFNDPGPFNDYAHFLMTAMHGWLIYVFEVGLLVIAVFHIVTAVTVAWMDKRAARAVGYKYGRDAKGTSRKTLASKTMIYSGAIILVYVIAHIYLFKFGNHELDSTGVPNLYKTVVATFKDPVFTIFTVVAMLLLGFHLRHGFWSAFQSLGWANDRYLPGLMKVAWAFAFVMAVGFIVIPVLAWVWLDPNAVRSMGGH